MMPPRNEEYDGLHANVVETAAVVEKQALRAFPQFPQRLLFHPLYLRLFRQLRGEYPIDVWHDQKDQCSFL